MVILHLGNYSLAYRDNDELSILRAADRNIDNILVGFVKEVNK